MIETKEPSAVPVSSSASAQDWSGEDFHPDLSFFDALPAGFGEKTLQIRVAGIEAALHGLSARQHADLAARYGIFARPSAAGKTRQSGDGARGVFAVSMHRSPRSGFLRVPRGSRGETYRLMTRREGEALLAWSYEWASLIRFGENAARLVAASEERVVFDRIVENFLRVSFAHLALESGGLLLHGAAVVRGERAYVFFGPSGSGKTTVTTLSPDALVLSDDLILIAREGRSFSACSVPFRGLVTPPATTDRRYPLAGLFRLVKNSEVHLEEVSRPRAVGDLVQSLPFVTDRPEAASRILDVASDLAEAVPVRRLHFRKDPGFWRLLESV